MSCQKEQSSSLRMVIRERELPPGMGRKSRPRRRVGQGVLESTDTCDFTL